MSDATKNQLSCPKCGGTMRHLKAGEAAVDRCESCYGIWLDKGERLKLLKDKELVRGMDIGPEKIGEIQDEKTEITCPRCKEPMRHMQDHAQKHIGFEICDSCFGSFFDAGELTDLSEFTLSERIKSLLGR